MAFIIMFTLTTFLSTWNEGENKELNEVHNSVMTQRLKTKRNLKKKKEKGKLVLIIIFSTIIFIIEECFLIVFTSLVFLHELM